MDNMKQYAGTEWNMNEQLETSMTEIRMLFVLDKYRTGIFNKARYTSTAS